MKTALMLLVAIPALAACSTTAYQPREGVSAAYIDGKQIHGDVERMNFAKQLQLELPAKVAVADVESGTVRGPSGRIAKLVGALSADTETYDDIVSLATDVDGVDERDGRLVERLREYASRHQADLLIVAERSERVVEETNAFAFLNILLLPMLFVPTQSDDVDVSLHATVYDVRNGVAYTTFDDHRQAHVSASLLAEDGALRSAKDDLFGQCADAMAESLGPKLRGIEKKRMLAR